MLTVRRLTVIATLAVLCSPAAAVAQRAMTLVDLLNIPVLSDPQLSPDGRQVTYVLSEPDWSTNERVDHLWRSNLDGTDAIQLTHGSHGESGARWSPDGMTIALLTRRGNDEATQIYLLPSAGGEARRLTTHPTAVTNITWAPDSTTIYFIAEDAKSAEQQARDKAKDDVFAFDENYQQQHLWSISLADGTPHRITEGDYSVIGYALSRDGRRIAFHRAPSPLFGAGDLGEVWVMGASGSQPLQITRNSVPENGARLSPDGAQVLFLSQANQAFDTYYNRKIFVAPSAGGPHRVVTGDLPYEVESAAWSHDGRSIFFVANMGVRSELFQLEIANGRARQITDGRHSIKGWMYAPAVERHVFAIDEPTNPGDIWTLASTSSAPARVTRVFEYLIREFRHPRQERVEWKGADGVTVDGLLFYPLDYQEGQRYPLAVQTHGGPQASDKYGFGQSRNYVQVLAAKGYAVLQPNYRGSTGYGDAFLRDMVGSYFKNSHLDVMTGVDHLVKTGLADPDRLVKMGWSGGGHMTNKIITFTNRFKAASSGAGAANWISMYAQSDVRTYRTPWFGGTPWQKDAAIDLYWEHSPLKYVANVTTPTIFLVGENDVRVPPPQAVEMYRALKSNGVPTHLYMAPREPHGWRELRHELFKMNVELEWFEKYATGRSYQWEQAPEESAGPGAGPSRRSSWRTQRR
jgi:dipeptidyl aminopeptidase/acylaminoacyl peptidase